MSCEAYAGAFANQTGGYITTLDSGLCGLCQYSSGDGYAKSFNVFYSVRQAPTLHTSKNDDHRHEMADNNNHVIKQDVWRNYGIFWAYIVFNFALVFFCSWLLLGPKLLKCSGGKKQKQSKNKQAKTQTEGGILPTTAEASHA